LRLSAPLESRVWLMVMVWLPMGSITNRKGSASQHESALDQVPRL
jgi:hypothetical protein